MVARRAVHGTLRLAVVLAAVVTLVVAPAAPALPIDAPVVVAPADGAQLEPGSPLTVAVSLPAEVESVWIGVTLEPLSTTSSAIVDDAQAAASGGQWAATFGLDGAAGPYRLQVWVGTQAQADRSGPPAASLDVSVGETEPAEEATEAAEEATEPAEEATEPAEEATEPAEEATEPAEEATEPAEEATEPAEDATEPTTEPPDADATEQPDVKPTDDATEPTDDATEPTDDATEPTDDATEPADEPTDDPTEDVDATEPDDEPAEPTPDRSPDDQQQPEPQNADATAPAGRSAAPGSRTRADGPGVERTRRVQTQLLRTAGALRELRAIELTAPRMSMSLGSMAARLRLQPVAAPQVAPPRFSGGSQTLAPALGTLEHAAPLVASPLTAPAARSAPRAQPVAQPVAAETLAAAAPVSATPDGTQRSSLPVFVALSVVVLVVLLRAVRLPPDAA